MKVVVIIPARYSSTRFPGKVLAPIAGKPMIQRVWERSSTASLIDEAVIATDDDRVFEAVESFGGKAVMTNPEHKSGTERCSEAAEKLDADIVVNVQGDEPLINPESLDLVVDPLVANESLGMSSLKFPIGTYKDYIDPNIVKVVCDDQENAIYFSRAPIPHYRDSRDLVESWKGGSPLPADLLPPPMKHIGVYAYRTGFLQAMARMPAAPIEEAEKLEQLRVLSWGFKIRMVTTPHDSVSIDVPGDVDKVERIIAESGG